MYHKQRQIKKLTTYIPVAETFRALASEQDCVFLDSSLVNDLGRFSIIGACPYLKLVKDGEKFFINEKEETGITFEDYLRNYLRDHSIRMRASFRWSPAQWDIFLMIMGANCRAFRPGKKTSWRSRMPC